MTTAELSTTPLPSAPQPPADEYPPDAVAPRFDEHGRKFVPEEPMPGVVNVPLGPIDALALSLFWANAATDAVATGSGEAWSFSETRAAHFLRIARHIQADCQEPFVSLSADQLEAFAAKHSGGVA